ncbi:gliding motility-associated C-terminal domain-containing protein, partial [Flavobacterium sp. 7A]|uniref:DUF7507 domain-containing protein n=1 Tax=Flavobacterium sp. 7A TaxID=2940571 RepID=UPI002227E8E3
DYPLVATAQSSTIPGKGTFVLNADGTYVFTPNVGFVGTVNIPYTMSDSRGATDVATVYIFVLPQPSIAIEKTGIYNVIERTVTYTYIVRNTGNELLNNVLISEIATNFTGTGILPVVTYVSTVPQEGSSATSIVTGAVSTYTATYALTQADYDAGQVTNQALVSATDIFGIMVKDKSDDTNNPTDIDTNGDGNPDDPTVTIITQTPKLEITKDAQYNDLTITGLNVGDNITYTFVVTNTGNVTIDIPIINDDLVTVSGVTPIKLAPGDIGKATATYILTQVYIDRGVVYNVATVTGVSPFGDIVTSEPSVDPTDPILVDSPYFKADCPTCTVVVLNQSPSIALTKQGDFIDADGNGHTESGDQIKYTFVITNTGNTALHNVEIDENTTNFTGTNIMPTWPSSYEFLGSTQGSSSGTLLVGESATYVWYYVIDQQDIISASLSNSAVVNANGPITVLYPSGQPVTDISDDAVIIDDDPHTTTVVPIEGCRIEVFNAISPNGDGLNDVFKIGGLECYPDNTVQVFNRWGVLVFERTGYNNSDRAFKGISEGRVTVSQSEGLPVGTYFYVLSYVDSDKVVHQKSGYLYLNK